MKVEEGRFVAERIPGAKFVEFPGQDHLPFVGDQDAILDEMEEFLTGVRHSLEPDTVLATVYQPIEFSNVMYRPITPDLRLHEPGGIKVRLVEKDEAGLWSETAFEGWSEFTEVADFLRDLGQVTVRSKSLSFLAEVEGKPIATGALTIAGDVALLAGASTIPAARRQGAQLALLEERLRYAASQGCTIGMMVALPGSGSQRNAERHGFRIAYTRTKWQLNQTSKGLGDNGGL